MAKRTLLAALALCLCLTGCARQETPPQPTDLPETPPPPSGILTDVGQAETLQDYYDRTAIIGRNEWVDGWFTDTITWAEEYAALEHPGKQAAITFAGGFFAPEGMFRDELAAAATLWDIALTADDGTQETLQVQVLHFDEPVEGGRRQYLSGLLSGDQILTRRPEVYAYLALDTRFAARMQTLPDVTPPQNARVAELDWLEDASFENIWILDDRYFTVDSRYAGDKTLVQVVDGETLEVLASWEKEGYWYQSEKTPGVLMLRHSGIREDGLVSCMEVRVKDGKPQLTENAVFEDTWQVGDTTVTGEEGSLLAGDRVLLQGDPGMEDATETVRYVLQSVLDDHRFLFACVGWEWTEYWGVYDLDTDTWARAWSGPDYYLDKPEDGATRALAFAWMADWQWGYHLLDLNTLEAHRLPVGHATEEDALEGYVEVNEQMTRMALIQAAADADYHITVVDLQTGSELFSWGIPRDALSGQPQVQLVGEHMLAVTLDRWSTDTSWVYQIAY